MLFCFSSHVCLQLGFEYIGRSLVTTARGCCFQSHTHTQQNNQYILISSEYRLARDDEKYVLRVYMFVGCCCCLLMAVAYTDLKLSKRRRFCVSEANVSDSKLKLLPSRLGSINEIWFDCFLNVWSIVKS